MFISRERERERERGEGGGGVGYCTDVLQISGGMSCCLIIIKIPGIAITSGP